MEIADPQRLFRLAAAVACQAPSPYNTQPWRFQLDADHPGSLVVRADRALRLAAAARDLRASFLNQPLQLPFVRHELVRRLGLVGHPQVLVRLGYGRGTPATPRRALEDVLVHAPHTR